MIDKFIKLPIRWYGDEFEETYEILIATILVDSIGIYMPEVDELDCTKLITSLGEYTVDLNIRDFESILARYYLDNEYSIVKKEKTLKQTWKNKLGIK